MPSTVDYFDPSFAASSSMLHAPCSMQQAQQHQQHQQQEQQQQQQKQPHQHQQPQLATTTSATTNEHNKQPASPERVIFFYHSNSKARSFLSRVVLFLAGGRCDKNSEVETFMFPLERLGDNCIQHQWHGFLTQCILGLAPLVFGCLILYHPPTYGKLHTQHIPTTTSTTGTTQNNNKNKASSQPPRRKKQGMNWGPLLPARICWALFESPPVLWASFGYWNRNEAIFQPANAILLVAFATHYVYRAIVYPLAIMPSTSQFPLGLMLFTIPYTMVNGL
jgi:hypothetical protein